MSTAVLETPQQTVETRPETDRYHVSFLRLVRSEWIKFTSLRSTWWALALVAVMSLGLSLLQAFALSSFASESGPPSGINPNDDAVMVIVFATVLTQLLAVIIGTITVTGEYSTGMIRSTVTAAPSRIKSVLAKALVVASAMFVFSVLVFAVAALITGAILPTGALDLADPNSSVMPLLGAALYLALIAVVGVGLGYLLRSGPGALAAGVTLVFVAPIIVIFFPRIDDFAWIYDAASYLPSNAAQSLFMGSPLSGNVLEMWPALVTIMVWAVASLIAGAAVLKLRDA